MRQSYRMVSSTTLEYAVCTHNMFEQWPRIELPRSLRALRCRACNPFPWIGGRSNHPREGIHRKTRQLSRVRRVGVQRAEDRNMYNEKTWGVASRVDPTFIS